MASLTVCTTTRIRSRGAAQPRGGKLSARAPAGSPSTAGRAARGAEGTQGPRGSFGLADPALLSPHPANLNNSATGGRKGVSVRQQVRRGQQAFWDLHQAQRAAEERSGQQTQLFRKCEDSQLKQNKDFLNQNILLLLNKPSLTQPHLKMAAPHLCWQLQHEPLSPTNTNSLSIREETRNARAQVLGNSVLSALTGNKPRKKYIGSRKKKKKNTQNRNKALKTKGQLREHEPESGGLSASASSPCGRGCLPPLSSPPRTHRTCASSSPS